MPLPRPQAPPRRTLRSHQRHIPPSLLLARIAAAMERAQPPRKVSVAHVFTEVWKLGRAAAECWTVSDLRELGLIDAPEAKPLGYELARVLRDERRGIVGPFALVRLGSTRDGVAYKLRRYE